jgi:hypothetical protein
MPRIRRAAMPLLFSTAELAAAAVVLGRPDPALAAAFFTTSLPGMQQAVAGVQMLLWLTVAASLVPALAVALGGSVSGLVERRRRWLWAAGILAVGLVLLVAGTGQRLAAGSPSMGGGSLQEARQQIGG